MQKLIRNQRDPGLTSFRKELEVSLTALANRIDQGYTVEVRAGELPAPEDEEEDAEEPSAEEKQIRSIVEQVLESQEKLNFANQTGETILRLPEPKDNTDDGSATDPAKGQSSKSPQGA